MDTSIHAKNSAGALPLLNMDMLAMTGLTLVDFVKVSPNIKSFQDQVNCERNRMDKGAFAIGTKMYNSVFQSDAPSIFADSQTSLEIPRKKLRRTNIQKGIQIAV